MEADLQGAVWIWEFRVGGLRVARGLWILSLVYSLHHLHRFIASILAHEN
jgi:hypothetical protein